MTETKKLKTILASLPSETGYSHLVAPVGLCMLSANMKKHDLDCKVWDFSGMKESDIKNILLDEKPDIFGVSCLTIDRGLTLRYVKLVKSWLPDCIIILGGSHASLFPEHMFKSAPVDYVVMFEGDHTLIELVDCIANDRSVKDIKGLAYKEGHRTVINPRRELESDIDSLPFPDYSNINFSNYTSDAFDSWFIPIMTSRGCPFGCAFCSPSQYWERKIRYNSAEHVLKEIRTNVNRYGITNLFVYDDNFILDKKRLIEICKGIIAFNKKIRFMIAGNVRAIDEERLYWLKKAGCVCVGFGMESGSDLILKNVDKPQTKEEIRKAVMLVKKYKMRAVVSLIVGCPGETKETIKETAELLNEILPERLWYGGTLFVLPSTKICAIAKHKKLLTDDTWLNTTDTIYFTAEHSMKELQKLEILLLYYQAKKRPLSQKIEFLKWYIYLQVPTPIKYVLRNIYYKFNYAATRMRFKKTSHRSKNIDHARHTKHISARRHK